MGIKKPEFYFYSATNENETPDQRRDLQSMSLGTLRLSRDAQGMRAREGLAVCTSATAARPGSLLGVRGFMGVQRVQLHPACQAQEGPYT